MKENRSKFRISVGQVYSVLQLMKVSSAKVLTKEENISAILRGNGFTGWDIRAFRDAGAIEKMDGHRYNFSDIEITNALCVEITHRLNFGDPIERPPNMDNLPEAPPIPHEKI